MSENKLGKSFVWIAWLLALGLLAFAFQDYLDKQHNPNQVPSSSLVGNRVQVTLMQNKYGHYVTSGTINFQPVVFLLDTGATQVSIPEHIAMQLGLEKGRPYAVSTANGQVTVYSTYIDSLTIGNIQLEQVSAHINPGMRSDEILLGMSALKRVEFRQTGKQLTLTAH